VQSVLMHSQNLRPGYMTPLVSLLATPLHITCSNDNMLSFFDNFLLNVWYTGVTRILIGRGPNWKNFVTLFW